MKLRRRLVAIPLAWACLAAPAFAGPQTVAEMKDLPQTHWSFTAVQALVERYQVMEGFPDKEFKGGRPVTRYEVAALLFRTLQKIEDMIALAGDLGAVKKDLETIKALQQEFKKELDARKAFEEDAKEHFKNLDEAVAALKPTGPTVKFGGSFNMKFYNDFDDTKARYLSTVGFDISSSARFNEQLSFSGKIGGSFTGNEFKAGLSDKDKDKATNVIKLKGASVAYELSKEYNLNVKFGFMPTAGVDVWSDISSEFGAFGSVYNPFTGKGSGFNMGPDVGGLYTAYPGGDTSLSIDGSWGPFAAALGLNTKVISGSMKYDLGVAKLKVGGHYDQVGLLDETISSVPPETVVSVVLDLTPLALSKVPDETGKMVPFDPDKSSFNFNATLQANLLDNGEGKEFFRHKDVSVGLAGKFMNFHLGVATVVALDEDTDILVGGYVITPKLGNFLTLKFGLQDPFVSDASGFREGTGKAGNQAGFSIIARIDNPIIPNLEIEYANSAAVIFGADVFRDVLHVRTSTRF